MTRKDIIKLSITEATILNATEKARQQIIFHDNLRKREPIIQLDSKIRGYIGEVGLKGWFASHDIHFAKANTMKTAENMDIDLVYETKNQTLHLEVKTSLVADKDRNWDDILRNRDIKLIRRKNQKIEELTGDLHLQIYFYGHRKKRDNFLKSLNLNLNIPINELYKKMQLQHYLNNTYFIGWIDKPTLIQQINHKSRKTWAFAKREFWLCNLGKDAKKPIDILEYLYQI
ncbi:MAG: hypothetical protein ACPG3Z_03145 [Saprospiraceae bacterium]